MYVLDHRGRAAAQLRAYREQSSLLKTVQVAALGRTTNGKHPHQRRIPNSILRRFCSRLTVSAVGRSRTFDALYHEVFSGRVHGIGDLAVYDTALRIGAYLGLSPQRVYLHRGARERAAALGLGRGRKTLEVRELPKPFGRLRPYEIEDCLCIYKEALKECVRG